MLTTLPTHWQEREVSVLGRIATETTQQRLMQQRLESELLSHNESFYPAQPSNPLELAWEKGFAVLKKFKARGKHCRVPRGHREGAFNLGTWVVNQRNRKETLSVQRSRAWKRLGLIGLCWSVTPGK